MASLGGGALAAGGGGMAGGLAFLASIGFGVGAVVTGSIFAFTGFNKLSEANECLNSARTYTKQIQALIEGLCNVSENAQSAQRLLSHGVKRMNSLLSQIAPELVISVNQNGIAILRQDIDSWLVGVIETLIGSFEKDILNHNCGEILRWWYVTRIKILYQFRGILVPKHDYFSLSVDTQRCITEAVRVAQALILLVEIPMMSSEYKVPFGTVGSIRSCKWLITSSI